MLYREVREESLRAGDDWGAIICDSSLAQLDLYQHEYESARAGFASVLDSGRRFGQFLFENEVLRDLGLALLGLNQRAEARSSFRESLDIATEDNPTPGSPLFDALDGIALAARYEEASQAARLRGAVNALRHTAKVRPPRRTDELEQRLQQPLIDALGQEAWEQEQAAGATMTLDVIELARSLVGAPDEHR